MGQAGWPPCSSMGYDWAVNGVVTIGKQLGMQLLMFLDCWMLVPAVSFHLCPGTQFLRMEYMKMP